ncbi:MAG: PH domain-containing protein [Alphaproteobacteria bacterium]|nr:PH domain-containing protein [Alphaproteobacteria bacterium]
MMTAPESETVQTLEALKGDTWHRLAPAAVIHFIVKFLIGFVKNGVQNVAYLGGIAIFTGDNRWLILGSLAVGATVILLAGGILSYLNFRFRMDGRSFLIRKGVFNKKRLTLSFERIQNVAVKEPLYFRPFGLVSLALESAGSADEEVSLAGIPKAMALDIRQAVLRTSRAPKTHDLDEAPEEETAETETLLIAQKVSELARYGLSNNNIWVLAGLATGALFQQAEQWEPQAEEFVRNTVIPVTGDDNGVLGLMVAAGIFALVMLLMLLSVLGAIVVNYGYRLSYAHGRYHRTKGLFEKQETSVPETKIQSLQIGQPWPAKLLRRWHLVVRQVGFSSKNDVNTSKKERFIIPSVTPEFYQPFASKLFGDIAWDDMIPSKISRLFIWKTLKYFLFLPGILITAATSYFWGPIGFLPLAAPLLLLPLIMLRHHQYRYWSNGKTGMVQRGFVGTRTIMFAFRKVQNVALQQSPSQRRHELATLIIQLAGQTITVPYMPYQDAAQWRDTILFEVETSREAWM